MILYPSIPGSLSAPIGKHCISFYKYDGNNLRFSYSKKRGWHKFGSRTTMFDQTSQEFGEAIPLFMETLAYPIENILYKKYRHININSVTVFCEYYGEKSIAGIHAKDDKKMLRLFDVAINDEFIIPKLFVRHFGDLEYSAEVVYEGHLTESFITSIREGTFESIRPIFEGVVCKGDEQGNIWRCKIKTNQYKDILQKLYNKEWTKFWE
jgi:hypothetical protein